MIVTDAIGINVGSCRVGKSTLALPRACRRRAGAETDGAVGGAGRVAGGAQFWHPVPHELDPCSGNPGFCVSGGIDLGQRSPVGSSSDR